MGITQARLAKATGISQTSICHIERGKKEPRASTLAKIADALETTVDSFFISLEA
jgi:transcriptional regulator with XRE-family HTH domain